MTCLQIDISEADTLAHLVTMGDFKCLCFKLALWQPRTVGRLSILPPCILIIQIGNVLLCRRNDHITMSGEMHENGAHGCKAMSITLVVELEILDCICHFICCNEQKANFSLQHNEPSQALKRSICFDLDVHGWRVGQTTEDKEILNPSHHTTFLNMKERKRGSN